MYVFGMDLPIMEIMFIQTTILLLALIFLYIEIKKLRSLLMIEQSDLKIFEEDLNALKPKVKEDRKQKIKEYVENCRKKGYPLKEIQNVFEKKGWPKELYQEFLRQ